MWNVAPQTFQPVVRLNRDTREREIVMMRWGLIPYWAKDPQIGLSTINAKAETVATAPSFQIGRASCRERGYCVVYISVVAVSLKKDFFQAEDGIRDMEG